MKNITVLGGGVSGLALIEAIRQKNNNCKIRLVDKRCYHFSKSKIIANPADTSGIIEFNKWAGEKNVEFIEARVDRVNLSRKRIYLSNKGFLTFDELAITTGLFSKEMPIKGKHREGFFYLSEINPTKLKDLLKLSSEVCVYVSTWLGIKLSVAINALGKEVRLVSSNLDFLSEYKERVIELLKEKNIFLHPDSSIEEAIGEGLIKAVKLFPLKVFSSRLVLIDSGFTANLDFLEEEIISCDTFFTDFEGVYLLGDITRSDIENEIFNSGFEGIKEQAVILADYLSGGKRPVFQRKETAAEDRQKIIEDFLKENQR